MNSYRRKLDAGDMTVLNDMTRDELLSVIRELNQERKNALTELTRHRKEKREVMARFGYHIWPEFMESLK